MEDREDVRSIIPFLPLVLRSSTLSWPSAAAEEALEALSKGPELSHVDSGQLMAVAISDIRNSVGLSSGPFARFAAEGYALFFDELMPRNDSDRWFREILPSLATLLLKLPSLLETHWKKADSFFDVKRGRVVTGLRLLEQQEAGIVVLSQELIGALLACSLFSLFPIPERGSKHLPMINFDKFFANLHEKYREKQEDKIKCIVHYFERICSSMPKGFVSFERKVLLLESGSSAMSYPTADFWSESIVPLCPVEVHTSGFIEDHSKESLKVDFANKYIGGGALKKGCVQEEILFMIYPELISGMLFLPAMAENEAIEMVGAERFSNYTGYSSSFRFSGDCVDKTDIDCFGRRRTRFIAIDALRRPGKKQYELQFVLREINKAFCGFRDESRHAKCATLSEGNDCHSASVEDCIIDVGDKSDDHFLAPAAALELEGKLEDKDVRHSKAGTHPLILNQEQHVGIVTGNWGCGAYGGDPELKTVIQWLAASQALRPSLTYYTFGLEALQNLAKVSEWILMQKWTVGDLWNMLLEYSSQRSKEGTRLGFFSWLLPSGVDNDAVISNSMGAT
ncbi:poly(ADP-ribose) glycohydrolase 1-like isoform X2 [Punica granatum]|uniref:poly(ADP-ribose) glycohydrolase n=1 Tax=Punica granatum TaxID=22663 RepID=A0A6P8DA53_PUNGR|nr:poly(ADP-ribose) glycohydrolase 1-like isoform X2 [Punica granatum]